MDEYSKSEKKDKGTKQDRLKDDNLHKPVYTHKAQKNMNKSRQPKSRAQSNTHGQTLHNPDKPEKPTDTQTKDIQQSGNTASAGSSGNCLYRRTKINLQFLILLVQSLIVLKCEFKYHVNFLDVDKSKQKYVKKTSKDTDNPSSGDQAKISKTLSNDESEHIKCFKYIYKQKSDQMHL